MTDSKPPEPIATPVGPATTADWRKEYENIGPVFRYAGLLLLFADLALLALDIKASKPVGWPDVALHLGMALAALLLIRPPGLDNLIKTIADKVPFIGYRKPDA